MKTHIDYRHRALNYIHIKRSIIYVEQEFSNIKGMETVPYEIIRIKVCKMIGRVYKMIGRILTLRLGASPYKLSWDKMSFCQGAGDEKLGEETPAASLAASRRAPSNLSSMQSYGFEGTTNP